MVCDRLEMPKTVYSILFMSSFEKKERFLGEFYLRLNEKKKNKRLASRQPRLWPVS